MKILFIVNNFNQIGGIEKYNKDFLNALNNAGANIFIVQLRGISLIQKIFFILRITLKVLQKRPKIIHCSHIAFSPICFFIKRIFGIEYTVALYGIEAMNIKNALELQAVVAAKVIIIISDYTKNIVLSQLPQIQERIFMLPSAVDGKLFYIKEKSEQLIDKYHLKGNRIILTLSRLSPTDQKGQDRVLKALLSVLKEFPDLKYIIAGKGNDPRVDTLLTDNFFKNHVVLVGPVEDEKRVDFYNLADVFVLPSKKEGFGIVFIESLACGVPVIASNNYGCPQGLLSGELGLLVNPDDPEDIARAIIRVLRRDVPKNLLNKQWLRQKCLEIYSIESYNNRVVNFLSLINKKL